MTGQSDAADWSMYWPAGGKRAQFVSPADHCNNHTTPPSAGEQMSTQRMLRTGEVLGRRADRHGRLGDLEANLGPRSERLEVDPALVARNKTRSPVVVVGSGDHGGGGVARGDGEQTARVSDHAPRRWERAAPPRDPPRAFVRGAPGLSSRAS